MVEYTYDAWGNILDISGSKKDTLGQANPLRYRGYVYDHETQLYYCQSRYYDPEIGRWLNADSFTSTGQGFIGDNMFAYCNNNPIRLIDSSGFSPYDCAYYLVESSSELVEEIILYEGQAISATISGNTYYIDLHIVFDGVVDVDYLINGLKNYREGTYTYDGYTFSIYMNVNQGTSSGGHAIYVNTFGEYGRSYCTYNVRHWKKAKESTIFLYEHYYSTVGCDWTFAHEIGHSLGIGDYYTKVGQSGYSKTFPSIMNIPGQPACAADAYMLLLALVSNRRQSW